MRESVYIQRRLIKDIYDDGSCGLLYYEIPKYSYIYVKIKPRRIAGITVTMKSYFILKIEMIKDLKYSFKFQRKNIIFHGKTTMFY